MDDTVEFMSKGDAGINRENRMGTYIKTNQMAQGFAVFEQAKKEEEELQYFLFVGLDGTWRVGPDITTYSGSVLKHPKTCPTPKLPPKTGWRYYHDDGWIKDDSLEAIVKVKESSPKQQELPHLPYHTITLNHGQNVFDVVMSKNNQFIYTGGEGGYIKVWDIHRPPNQISRSLRAYTTSPIQLNIDDCSYVTCMKMAADGSSLVVGGTTCNIDVIDLTGPYPTFKSQLESSYYDCHCLAISPDGRLCYSCYMDESTVKVWDIHNESLVGEFRGHAGTVSCLDISVDGSKLWTGGVDQTVRVWDPRAFSQMQQYELDTSVRALACCPIDDWVAVGTGRSNVKFLRGSRLDIEKLELEVVL